MAAASIRAKLTSSLIAVASLALVAIGLTTSAFIEYAVTRYMETRLEHDAESLLFALRLTPEGRLDIDELLLNPIFQRVYSGHYFRVDSEGESLRSRSLWQYPMSLPEVSPGAARMATGAGPYQQPLLIRVAGYERFGRAMVIGVAEELAPAQRLVRRWQTGFALVALVTLLALAGLQQWLLRRGLTPLITVGNELRALEDGSQDRLSEDVPREIRPLVDAINRLAKTLHKRLQRSRNAAGNLAHALKTPLAAIHQSLGAPELHGHPDLKTRLERNVSRIERQVDHELSRARVLGQSTPGTLFRAGRDLPDLLDTLSRIHQAREIRVAFEINSERPMNADREDMLELLGTLLDNAYKWAKQRVRVSVHDDNGSIEFLIEDDGPGVALEDIQCISQRGGRLDESAEGHGLGLSIAHDIAHAYHGTLAFDRSGDLGGLRVAAHLPRRPPPVD